AVHDRQRNHLESFHVEEHGEILTRAAELEAGGYLLQLTGADGLSTVYELRLFSLAELASKNRSESAGDPEVKGVATVSLREGMSRAEGLRLARAKARANAVNGTVIAAKAGAATGDAPTGP